MVNPLPPIDGDLSRISKLFVDRDAETPEAALSRRMGFGVTLVCGEDVAASYTLQLAVLTAARIGIRCFPGAVRALVSPTLSTATLRLWPGLKLTFGQALAGVLGAEAIDGAHQGAGRDVVFGAADGGKQALRVTFDGWIAQVGPTKAAKRLAERELFPAAGILAAALALSELFLSFAGVSIEAGRRTIGLSLWRPDLGPDHPDALGKAVDVLPAAQWILGLGHLGNAYLWALGTLPYADPSSVDFVLFDFDQIGSANIETCLLFQSVDVGARKTRIAAAWLERRGFRTTLVERRLDEVFRRQADEPGLAFCGFDSNPARRHLASAGFPRVVESGLGAMAHNFDTVSLHALPHPRLAAELWPDLDAATMAALWTEQERAARENPGYLAMAKDECGRALLAGKAVGVPFVGAAAGSFAVAEAVRLLSGGPAYSDLKLRLGIPSARSTVARGDHRPEDASGIAFSAVRQGWSSATA